MLMPKPLWIGQVGDYWFGDYEGEYPVVDGPDAGTAGTVDTTTSGSPGYRVHSFCCCGRVSPPVSGPCCEQMRTDALLLGKNLKWLISNPCSSATLNWIGAQSEWTGFMFCTPDGGSTVTIDLRIKCLTNEEAGEDQYRLFISCNNPNPPGGFESYETFPSSMECPDPNAPGYPCGATTQGIAFWLVPPAICGVPGGQLWGGTLTCA